jgi:predicted DNA-binding protein
VTITITLPQELEPVLADMVRETGRTAEELALSALLERLEDFEDVKIAEERLRDQEGPGIPLEEVMRKYGLAASDEKQSKPAAE